MDSNQFDKIIKAKSENLNADVPSSDWHVFSEILRNEEGFQDIDFDDAVQNKILNHQTQYNSQHWQILKNRLEKEERLHRHIYISKSVELLAVFLLVFTFVNLVQKEEQRLPIQLLHPEIFVPKQSSKQIVYDQPEDKESRRKNKEAKIQLLEKKSKVFELISVEKRNYKKDIKNHLSQINSLSAIGTINTNQMEVVLERSFAIDKMLLKPLPHPSKSHKYITPTISAGISITSTPADPSKNVVENLTLNKSFGAGALFSSRINNSELISGLLLSRKSYIPQSAPTTIYQDRHVLKQDIKQITYDFLTVPFHFKHFINPIRKTKPYIKTGIDVNLLMNANYQVSSENLGLANSIQIAEGSRYSNNEEDKPEGILNSGNLINNLYLAVNAEIGIERKISEKNNFCLGLSYSKYFMIEGLGPNKDKYDALTFNVGLKHALN